MTGLRMLPVLGLALCAVSADALDTLYGPETFSRAKGRPNTVQRLVQRSGFDGPFFLSVRNGEDEGGKRCSSAEIRLDGQIVLGPNDFSQTKPGISVEIALLDRSQLEVTVRSAPGCEITIWIEGTAESLRVDPVLDQDFSVTAPISIVGGSVSTTLPDGTTLTLDVPEAALSQATNIKLTPLAASTALPAGPPLIAGAHLEPEGLVFARPVRLRIDLGSSPPPEVVGFKYDGAGEEYRLAPVVRDGSSFSLDFYHFSGGGLKERDSSECHGLLARAGTDPSAALEYLTACADDALAAEAIDWMTASLSMLEAALTTVVAALDSANSPETLRRALGGYAGWWSQAVKVEDIWESVSGYVGDEYGPLQAQLESKMTRMEEAARRNLPRVMAQSEAACTKTTSCETMKAALDDLLYIQRWVDLMPGFGDLVVDMTSLCGGALGLQVTTDSSVYVIGMTSSATATPGHVVPDPTFSVTWSSSSPVLEVDDPSSGVFRAHLPGTATITAAASYCGLAVSGASSPVQVMPECSPLPDGTATCSMTLRMLAYRPPHPDWIGTGERRRLLAELTNLFTGDRATTTDPIVWEFEGPGDGVVLWEEVSGSYQLIDIIGSRTGDLTVKATVGDTSLSATLPLRVVRLETYRGGPAGFYWDEVILNCRYQTTWDVATIGLVFWGDDGSGRSSGLLSRVVTPLMDDAVCPTSEVGYPWQYHWVVRVSGQSLTGPWLSEGGAIDGALGDGLLVLTFSGPHQTPVTVALQRTSIGVHENP